MKIEGYAQNFVVPSTARDRATTIVDTIMYDLLTKRYTSSKQDEVCYYLEQRQKWIETVLDGGRAELAVEARRLALETVFVVED